MLDGNKILIVDDRAENLFALETVLRPLGGEIVQAQSGEAALKATLHHDFALAIVDVQMPGMDGYELARLLRSAKETRFLPIIFLSAVFSDAAHIFLGYASGAVDFITKPFMPEILLSKVRIFLDLDRSRKELMRQGAALEKMVEQQRQANQDLQAEIAERRTVEKALKEAKEAAEAATRAKSEFLANMSHEIRTPMNGIMGMTELALMTDIPDEAREYLGIVRQSSDHLLEIINNILDIAKIEAGRMELEHRLFDLAAEVEAVTRPLSVLAKEKGLELTAVIAPEVPGHLVGDKGRLKQILTNIVGNAVKFTCQGTVTVTVGRDDGGGLPEGSVRLVFQVKDTGIGVPEEKLDTVFESFSQMTSSAHVKYGGTGLGLSIAKQLVEMMGGSIRAARREEGGSVFTFTAVFVADGTPGPVASAASPAAKPAESKLRILLVEDNEINRVLMVRLLRLRGHEVEAAPDGRQALDALALSAFDLVFMDVRMPVMDGLEATRRIRAGEVGEDKRAIPIVALTAHALVGDRERFLAAGMDDYLSKPIDTHEVARVLKDFAKR